MKETFLINTLSDDIEGDMVFRTTVNYDNASLDVFTRTKQVCNTTYSKGDIEFRDAQGNMVFMIPRPVIFDTPDKIFDRHLGSWVTDPSSVETAELNYILKMVNGHLDIYYFVPLNYLKSNTTNYPVHVDPSISSNSIIESIRYTGLGNGSIMKEDSSGISFISGSEMVLCSDLSIIKGGVLTLDNVSLTVDSPEEWEFNIYVETGGTLNIVNGSRITKGNNQSCYGISYYPGSKGFIESSSIENISNNGAGLLLMSDITVMNSTIMNGSGNGICVLRSSPFISNNKIYSNSNSGIIVGCGGAPEIINNKIFGNTFGIRWDGDYIHDDLSTLDMIEYCDYVYSSQGRIYPMDLGMESTFTTVELTLCTGSLYDAVVMEIKNKDDCIFQYDILDGRSSGVIKGLENLTSEVTDISGINPFEHPTIRLRGKFLGNRTLQPYLNSWRVRFRPVKSSGCEGETGSYDLSLSDEFGGYSLNPRWDESGFQTQDSDMDVDGWGYLTPVDYGSNGSGWHGPLIESKVPLSCASFILESRLDIRNSYFGMGSTRIELLDRNDEVMFRLVWSDSWNYQYTSRLTLSDSEKQLYDSGVGTEYNDFSGKLKLERSNSTDVEFYIDTGSGYQELDLSQVPAPISLASAIASVRISMAAHQYHSLLPVQRIDWFNFKSIEYYKTGADSPILDNVKSIEGTVSLGSKGFEDGSSKDEFTGNGLDERWTRWNFGTNYSDMDVDGSGFLEPLDYGINDSNWHGPNITTELETADKGFILECGFDIENDHISMGKSVIELRNFSETLFTCTWSDVWAGADCSRIILRDNEKVLFNSGTGLVFNDFKGRIKLQRISNNEIRLFIDSGYGYWEYSLQTQPSQVSLSSAVENLTVSMQSFSTYRPLPNNKLDFISFSSSYQKKGSYLTGMIRTLDCTILDTLSLDIHEPDAEHFIYASLVDSVSLEPIKGYEGVRGDLIDLSAADELKGSGIRLLFELRGNGTSTPFIKGWRLYNSPMVMGNEIYNNSEAGIFCNESAPTITGNVINYNKEGIRLFRSSAGMRSGVSPLCSFQTLFRDPFLSVDKIHSMENLSQAHGAIRLKDNSSEGHLISSIIEARKGQAWGHVQILNSLYTNSTLNLSILDAETGEMIPNFMNLTGEFISLNELDPMVYPKIRLRADLTGNGSNSPALIEWQVTGGSYQGYVETFEEGYGGISVIDNLTIDDGKVSFEQRDWWNMDYVYRRELVITEELGIQRNNESHDLSVDLSSWEHQPVSQNGIRLVSSNNSEMDRTITAFVPGEYLNLSFNVSELSANGTVTFYIYYGCEQPDIPVSANISTTKIIMDDDQSLSDLGGGTGPEHIENRYVNMDFMPDAPVGEKVVRFSGNDINQTTPSYWYPEINSAELEIPQGYFFGYFMYWDNSTEGPSGTKVSHLTAGVDANFSNGDSMGTLDPFITDQNGIPITPVQQVTNKCRDNWYYRYTSQLEGKTIDSFFLAYDDGGVNGTLHGNFTVYFDYIFIGPNRGPVEKLIGDEETIYPVCGLVVSEEICPDSISGNRWGEFRAADHIPENTSITYQVLQGQLGSEGALQPVPAYESLTCPIIDLNPIDTSIYPSLRIGALFEGDGNQTPEIDHWSLSMSPMISCGSISDNDMNFNDIGIWSSESISVIHGNRIHDSSISGVLLDQCTRTNITTTHFESGLEQDMVFESSGRKIIDIPSTPGYFSMDGMSLMVNASGYKSLHDNEGMMEFSAYIENSSMDAVLNSSLSLDVPDEWCLESLSASFGSLTSNGTAVYPEEVGLRSEISGHEKAFLDHWESVLFNSTVLMETANPVKVNFSSSADNVKANISCRTDICTGSKVQWKEEEWGLSALIELSPPESPVKDPILRIFLPSAGSSGLNGSIIDNGRDISEYLYTIQGVNGEPSYIQLLLSDLQEIGDSWELADGSWQLKINLIYSVIDISIDVHDDGIADWVSEGVFKGPDQMIVQLSSDGSSRSSTSQKSALIAGLNSGSASAITLSCLRLNGYSIPRLTDNEFRDCSVGVMIKNTPEAVISSNTFISNGIGLKVEEQKVPKDSFNRFHEEADELNILLDDEGGRADLVRIPAGSYIEDMNMYISGERILPQEVFGQKNLTVEGRSINNTQLALNSSFWVNAPAEWNISEVKVIPYNVHGEMGETMAFWSHEQIEQAGVKSSSWTNGDRYCNMTAEPEEFEGEVAWMKSFAGSGTYESFLLTLEEGGALKAFTGSDQDVLQDGVVLSQHAGNGSTPCFEGLIESGSGTPLVIYSSGEETGGGVFQYDKLVFRKFIKSEWGQRVEYDIEGITSLKAISVPGTDKAVILAGSRIDARLYALLWNGYKISDQWTLSENHSGEQDEYDMSYGVDGYSLGSVFQEGEDEICFSSYDGLSWSEKISYLIETGGQSLSSVKMTEMTLNDEVLLLTAGDGGSLWGLNWNVGENITDLALLTDSLSGNSPHAYDLLQPDPWSDLIALWSNGSNDVEWRRFNGTLWSGKSNITGMIVNDTYNMSHAEGIEWLSAIGGSSAFSNEIIALSSTGNLVSFQWNGTSLNSSRLLAENVSLKGMGSFSSAILKPDISSLPLYGISVQHNTGVTMIQRNLLHEGEVAVFNSEELAGGSDHLFSVNKTSKRNASVAITAEAEIFNRTNLEWNEFDSGYYANIALWGPDINISSAVLRLDLPHYFYSDIKVNATSLNITLPRSSILDGTRQLGFITIDLASSGIIGEKWNSDDGLIDLNITLYYTAQKLDIQFGYDDKAPLFTLNNWSGERTELNLTGKYIIQELNRLSSLCGVDKGYVQIPLVLMSDSFWNITIDGLDVNISNPVVLQENLLYDNVEGMNLEADCIVSCNTISNCSGSGITCSDVGGYVQGNTFSQNHIGIEMEDSRTLLYGNDINNSYGILANTIGIYSKNSGARISQNLITGAQKGIVLKGNDNSSEVIWNEIVNNDIGLFSNSSGGLIDSNLIQGLSGLGQCGILTVNSSMTVQDNIIQDNPIGINCTGTGVPLFDHAVVLNLKGNRIAGNSIGLFTGLNASLRSEGSFFMSNAEAVRIEQAEDNFFNDSSFIQNGKALTVINGKGSIYRSSFRGDGPSFSTGTGGYIFLSDVSFQGGSMSELSNMAVNASLYRTVEVRILDDNNQPISEAEVEICDGSGESVFNIDTDQYGSAGELSLLLGSWDNSGNGTPVFSSFTPHGIKTGYYHQGLWTNATDMLLPDNGPGLFVWESYLGQDTDNDGIIDGKEIYVIGSDENDPDSDDDGLMDGTEIGINDTTKPSSTGAGFIPDMDPGNVTHPLINDTDGDGLSDGVEDNDCNGRLDDLETDPSMWDTDGDRIPDGWIDWNLNGNPDPGEYEDLDLDGVLNKLPWSEGGETDPLSWDTDGGGIDDLTELETGQDPLAAQNEWNDADADCDGLADSYENFLGTHSDNPDSDGDGVDDGREMITGLDPLSQDSDNDGLGDGTELWDNEIACRTVDWYEAEYHIASDLASINEDFAASVNPKTGRPYAAVHQHDDVGFQDQEIGPLIRYVVDGRTHEPGEYKLILKIRTDGSCKGIIRYKTQNVEPEEKRFELHGPCEYKFITFGFRVPETPGNSGVGFVYTIELYLEYPADEAIIDKFAVIELNSSADHFTKLITDPLDHDIDGDGLYDGVELRSNIHDDIDDVVSGEMENDQKIKDYFNNIIILEAEELSQLQNCTLADDGEASGAKVLSGYYCDNLNGNNQLTPGRLDPDQPYIYDHVCLDTWYTVPLPEGEYRVFIRYRSVISQVQEDIGFHSLLGSSNEYGGLTSFTNNYIISEIGGFVMVHSDIQMIADPPVRIFLASEEILFIDQLYIVRISNESGEKLLDNKGISDVLLGDTDGDGLSDGMEARVVMRTSFESNIELGDWVVADLDQDGMMDWYEDSVTDLMQRKYSCQHISDELQDSYVNISTLQEIRIRNPVSQGIEDRAFFAYRMSPGGPDIPVIVIRDSQDKWCFFTRSLKSFANASELSIQPVNSHLGEVWWMDPFDSDTDDDLLLDSLEVEVSVRSNFWFDEHFLSNSVGQGSALFISGAGGTLAELRIPVEMINSTTKEWVRITGRAPWGNYLSRGRSQFGLEIPGDFVDILPFQTDGTLSGSWSTRCAADGEIAMFRNKLNINDLGPSVLFSMNELLQSKYDPLSPDIDGDGLPDGEELYFYGTDPHRFDTDGDGMSDYWNVHYGNPEDDPDGDGFTNLEEYNGFLATGWNSTDPMRPTILIELDYVKDCSDNVWKPSNDVIEQVENALRNKGIELRILLDDEIDAETDWRFSGSYLAIGSCDSVLEAYRGKEKYLHMITSYKTDMDWLGYVFGSTITDPASQILERTGSFVWMGEIEDYHGAYDIFENNQITVEHMYAKKILHQIGHMLQASHEGGIGRWNYYNSMLSESEMIFPEAQNNIDKWKMALLGWNNQDPDMGALEEVGWAGLSRESVNQFELLNKLSVDTAEIREKPEV